MSNESIDKKLRELEEQLRTDHHRRPRLAMGEHRFRRNLNLPSIPVQVVPQASLETEAKLREIYQMSGLLNINGVPYRSDINDLQHLGELGNGTCGHVVKMLHKPSNVVIAVKQMRRSGNSDENKRILMDLEVVLRSHDCPYIVRCLGYFITEADVWICMELMASCFDKILKRLGEPIPEEILGKVTVATVNALSYLKEVHGVIHRDVKPSNILIDERSVVKLCDFGISGRLVDSRAKTRSAGCAAYMAPERIDPPDPQKPDYDIRADVWSLGITLVELATGNFPYCDCQNDFEVLSKVIQEEPPALPDSQVFSEEFKSFVRQCLTKDYRHRPKYAALLKHPFVKKASESGVSVASWLASALPPGSPRLTSPSLFHRRYVNGEKKNSDFQTTLSQLNDSKNSQKSDKETVASYKSTDNSKSLPIVQNTTIIQTPSEDKKNSPISPNSENTAVSGNISCRITGIETYENTFLRKLNISDESTERNNKIKLSGEMKGNCSKDVSEEEMHSLDVPPSTSSNEIIVSKSNFYVTQPSAISAATKESFLTSPQMYRARSHSNTSTSGPNVPTEKWQTTKFIIGSPNTKNYFSNLENKNQPFSGGGGPSSFDSYTSYEHNPETVHGGFRSYGSPEIGRRQYYSPSRSKLVYNYEHGNPRMDVHTGMPSNFNQMRDETYKNTPENGLSPPCFRPNAPTNYFVSTSVCTMSRYPGSPSLRSHNEIVGTSNFHHNVGGSCSQPASLEAYGDTRHNPLGQQSRLNEKNFPPPLWSPQLGRWNSRVRQDDKDGRRMSDASHHQQGNTSPIVLQRFYHQQEQRRSRRDWDSSSRQSSLSRDASIGRSPEPPRRIPRDPSIPRDHLPPQLLDNPMLREWRERELTPSRQLVINNKNESALASLETDRHAEFMSDKNTIVNSINPIVKNESDHHHHYYNDSNSKVQKSTYHHHMRKMQDRQQDSVNGDCQDAEQSVSVVHDRLRSEKKDGKEKTSVLRERDKETVNSGEKEDYSQMSPLVLRKLGKSGKDKEEQGWLNSLAGMMKKRFTSYVKSHLGANNTGGSRSSSPNRTLLTGGSAKLSRLTSHPQRITACDYDDVTKCSQDIARNFAPDVRNGSGKAPQVPPRRPNASWSLPASPLPTRPI